MASASKLEFVSKTLRSVLVSSKEGVAMSSLQGEYEALVGDRLPFKEFGHQTLEAFLKSIPTVVKLQRAPNGSVMCHAVVVNTLQHVASLVSRQKGKKSKRSSNKAKPGRSYARPTFVPRPKPVYSHSNFSKPHPVRPRFHIHAGRPSPQSYKPATSQGRFPPQSFTKPTQRPDKAINNSGDAKRYPNQQYKSPQSTYTRQPTPAAAAASKVAATTSRASSASAASKVAVATPSASSAAAASKVAAATHTASSASAASKVAAGTHTASSAAASSRLSDFSTSQQPTPGPWSGKLGSKRNQQSTASATAVSSQPTTPSSLTAVSSQPTKPVYENIYITVDNEYSKSKPTSKVAPAKNTAKPEWSSNFEVPPRFKKLMSPNETTIQADASSSKQKPRQPSSREQQHKQQPSPQQQQQQHQQQPKQQHQQQPKQQPEQQQQQQLPQQVNNATSGWIIKTLLEKPNGVWASALSTMHEKEFGVAMETGIIQQMADLSLIKKESIYNNDILYPQPEVNVDVKSTPAAESQPKTKPDTTLRHAAPAYPTHMHEPEAPSYVEMSDILESVCHRQSLPVSYRTDHVTLLDRSYVSVRCNAGSSLGTGNGATKRGAKQAASANILHQWDVTPEDMRPGLGGHEELCLRVEHQAGFCSCMPWDRANNSERVPACMSTSSQGLSWNPSSGWMKQDANRSALMTTETQGAMVESQQVEMRTAHAGSNLKVIPQSEVSQKGAYLMKSAVPQVRRERFCVLSPNASPYPLEAGIMSRNTPEIGVYDISSPAEVVIAGHQMRPIVQKGIQGHQSDVPFIPDPIPNSVNQATLSGMMGRKDYPWNPTLDYRKEVAGASQRPTNQAARPSRRGQSQDIRHALRETFGRTAIYETVKQTVTEDGLIVTVCFIAGSIIGVGTGPTKSEARREALKELLLKKQHQQKLKKAKDRVPILDVEVTMTPPAAHVREDPWMETSCKTCLPRNGTATDSSSFESQNGAVSSSTPPPTSSDVTVTTVTPSDRSSTNSSPCNPPLEDQVARSNPSPDFQAAENSLDEQWSRGQSPSSHGGEEASNEPSEGRGSPILEAPGVPKMQLPEEDEWDVYVAFITSLSDFYVILIGDDYSEQLIILEEEMRTFYQCCTWTVTEPPEEGDCYAAEFNREWLRVEVKAVEGDKVQCFLLDHGDLETTDVSSLRPLADPFIQLPFQLIHCKLSGSEQAADDDKIALQMFCQLALGKSLLAEITSRQGDRVEMDLFDNTDISILEQCMAAGI